MLTDFANEDVNRTKPIKILYNLKFTFCSIEKYYLMANLYIYFDIIVKKL